ncbi:hypothetical protein Ahy_B06g082429 [Arachis hypogaea]|uniref:Uncharacterized protein n=1 Tax=Arachis hypogaea TaxID=3818 RepID=A0A444YNA6_ARAHY|nr:hypothetical protein Ahy_B06g082429 [Arachis hypogaea]
MTTGRGVADQPSGRGHGRRRVSVGTLGNSGSSSSTLTTPNKEHDIFIRKIYDDRMGRRLQQMLEDIRERGDHLTSWLRPEIKRALYIYWETDETFKHRRLTNRANRALARSSKYTGGSATFMKTKAKLRLEAATQQSQQSGEDTSGIAISVVDPDAVWREMYKNRIYRLGSFFANSLRTSTLSPSSAYATIRAIDLKEGIDLRLQVQKLTQSLHEQAQELIETREKYQEILTHVTNMDDLRLEWREQVERLQRMEQQREVY